MHWALGGAVALLLICVGYLDQERTGWIQAAQTAQVGLAVAEEKANHERKIQALIKENQAVLEAQSKIYNRDRQEWANERNLLSGQIERQALESPQLYGNDFDLQLRIIMCEAAAGSDTDAVRACSDRANSAGPAAVALAITVTREEAERRIETCEAYELGEETDEEIQARYPLSRQDACDWSVTGFTFKGGEAFLQWLRGYVGYSKSIRDHAESRGDIIEILTDQDDEK